MFQWGNMVESSAGCSSGSSFTNPGCSTEDNTAHAQNCGEADDSKPTSNGHINQAFESNACDPTEDASDARKVSSTSNNELKLSRVAPVHKMFNKFKRSKSYSSPSKDLKIVEASPRPDTSKKSSDIWKIGRVFRRSSLDEVFDNLANSTSCRPDGVDDSVDKCWNRGQHNSCDPNDKFQSLPVPCNKLHSSIGSDFSSMEDSTLNYDNQMCKDKQVLCMPNEITMENDYIRRKNHDDSHRRSSSCTSHIKIDIEQSEDLQRKSKNRRIGVISITNNVSPEQASCSNAATMNAPSRHRLSSSQSSYETRARGQTNSPAHAMMKGRRRSSSMQTGEVILSGYSPQTPLSKLRRPSAKTWAEDPCCSQISPSFSLPYQELDNDPQPQEEEIDSGQSKEYQDHAQMKGDE